MRLSRLMSMIAVAWTSVLIGGCQGGSESSDVAPNASAKTDPASQELGEELTKVMNDASAKYKPLEYEYDEDLLAILDRVEARLAEKSPKLDPLPLPKLEESEQLAHFREAIRRWAEKTGKNLRTEIDSLKADVAARPAGGPAFHPEFHKKFAVVFDAFIPIEVEEIRERRNVVIHQLAKPLLDRYRGSSPDAVKSYETLLNQPPYNPPVSTAPTQ